MTSHDYIHINEAVKKHGKTRQTFYNYMHKGLIRTKKVNNKVYLNTSDIDQLMSGYIPNSIEATHVTQTSEAEEHPYGDVIEAKDIAASTSTPTAPKTAEHSTILKDLARLHQQYYDLKDSIIQKINHNKQDLLFDTKVLSQNAEQRIIIGISQKMKDMDRHITPIINMIQGIKLLNKKSLFRAGYGSFVLINVLITTYIL